MRNMLRNAKGGDGVHSELAANCGANRAEREWLDRLPEDARALVREQIGLIALRQRRAMKELKQLGDADDQLGESTEKYSNVGGKAGVDSEQSAHERVVKRRAAFDARQEVEPRLSKLGEQMLKAIEQLIALEGGTPGQDAAHTCIVIPDNGRGEMD